MSARKRARNGAVAAKPTAITSARGDGVEDEVVARDDDRQQHDTTG